MHIVKPIINPDVEEAVRDILAQFEQLHKWKAWGMEEVRRQGNIILLWGPPGCGKTTIARYLASKINRGFKSLDVSKIGGGEPGAIEGNINDFFDIAGKRAGGMTVYIDEAESLLIDRRKISGDALTWMLGMVNTILIRMNTYKGTIILSTNHADRLDEAMNDRILENIRVGLPDYERRKLLWRQKIPHQFPLQPTLKELGKLAQVKLNGRQIENTILVCAKRALKQKIKPKLSLMLQCAEHEVSKKLE